MPDNKIVIADSHHGGLYLSLMYLFQKRLGYDLRKPHGMDWHENKYFSYSNEEFIKGTLTCVSDNPEDDPDKCYGFGSGGLGKPITLEEATDRGNDIKFMVSSLHESEEPFARFIRDRAPKANLIRQVGNPNERVRFTKHALCSDLETYSRIKDTHHAILYHQEFNENLFRWAPVNLHGVRKCRSFLNYLADMKYLRRYYERLAREFVDNCDNVDFYMHGLKAVDSPTEGWAGAPKDLVEMSDWMADMHMLCQLKGWDGFGHIVHSSYAMGRPMMCRFGDYEKKLGGLLIKDGVTGVMLSGVWEDDRKKVMRVLDSDEYLVNMCWAARQRFEEVVSFNEEEAMIRKWLSEI